MIGIGPYILGVVAGCAWTLDYSLPATTTSVYGPIPIIGAGKNYLGNVPIVVISFLPTQGLWRQLAGPVFHVSKVHFL